MKCALLLVAASACIHAQPPAASAGQANRFLLQLREGAADLEWITPSSFRFRRTFSGALPEASGRRLAEKVKLAVTDSPEEMGFATEFLRASIRKDDLRIRVMRFDGRPLMSDATAAERRDGTIWWERNLEPGMRCYGLGAHTGASLDLRGMLVHDAIPFLLSTAGYGEIHVAPGQYDFDIERLRRGRYRIDIRSANLIDYYFYYGPTPKEIFEERMKTVGAQHGSRDDAVNFERMVELSLSGIVLPEDAVTRPVPADLRRRMKAYLGEYTREIDDRGYPMLHPLPFQFPGDVDADAHRDESMLGDELLLATGRSAYLPRGIWTNLQSNEASKGRQTIAVPTPPAVFARNGSIVPLAGSHTLELHYFPQLGGEFFLFEEDAGDYTQVHAAPAADIMRLEIEAKATRDFTWVVHHLEGVKTAATPEGRQLAEVKSAADLHDHCWYFDPAAKNVHVRNRVAAGEDLIVNLSF